MMFRISVDTGGTFTDVIVSDGKTSMTIGKALTTHGRIFNGMREAMENAASQLAMTLEELLDKTSLLTYGTTRSTNAIVTKNAAKTAFVTTEGFPDTLVFKEGGKFNPHDFSKDYPDPYIPRRHTFELRERINAEGAIITPLDKEQAKEVVYRIKAMNFEAVAVCLLWSIVNPEHERLFAELLGQELPGIPYTLSHALVPIVREYRRASATAIDASLKPLMQGHLSDLERDLRDAGYRGEILISTTEGGCSHIAAMIEKPIYTIGSGPAMAPLAGLAFSTLENLGKEVIICDTGGTTFDIGLVRDGRPSFTRDTWLGGMYTGDLLGVSAVDMRSIGAGGGSIAWIDQGGLMRVGPQSAGAEPGPACYGRGGTLPTVSDAAVVLGYFDPDYFLGGRMKLDIAAARAAIGTLAEKMSLGVEQTAFQVLSLASDLMMRAIADITVNEGVNPQESTIVAGGGAAGINIMTIARELGCSHVVMPKVASALSASGMQFADIVSEQTSNLVVSSNHFDHLTVNSVLAEMERRLQVFRAGLADNEDYHIELLAEARYEGQIWELDTPLPVNRFKSEADVAALVEAFHQVHERIFAVRDIGSAVQVVNWKARLVVRLAQKPNFDGIKAPTFTMDTALKRDCFFGDAKPVKTSIYKSSDLKPGLLIRGPAIVEEPTTTLVVYPGMSAEISGNGNYRLHFS